MRHHRTLVLRDLAWLRDVFVAEGIILAPIVDLTIRQGQAVGGWYGRTFLGFGHFQTGFWPDVADVGLYLLPEAARAHPFTVVGILRAVLALWEQQYHLRRMQAMTLAGWVEGERLLQVLGFEREGCLRECEPGVDYAVYGRLRKD